MSVVEAVLVRAQPEPPMVISRKQLWFSNCLKVFSPCLVKLLSQLSRFSPNPSLLLLQCWTLTIKLVSEILNHGVVYWEKPPKIQSHQHSKAPLSHVPKCHICMAFKHPQGCLCHHCPEQPLPELDSPFENGFQEKFLSKPPWHA